MSNTIQKAPKKKHISNFSREEYITDLEEMLMQKYRVGYSALHKRLVVEKAISYSTEQYDQINIQKNKHNTSDCEKNLKDEHLTDSC